MADTILRQTIIMLMLIMVGVFCSKAKLISNDTNKQLSGFVLQVVNPAMIFMSYQTDYRSELVEGLILSFAFSVGAFVVMIAVSYLLIRRKDGRDTEIERFSAIYSNCGFMGIPLVSSLFGMEGVFYLTAFITVFNIFVWTHGIIMLSGEKDMKKVVKVFYSPTMIAIALGLITFFLRLRLPSVPARAVNYIAELNTPLAMIVSGVTIAGTSLVRLLKKPSVYYVCFLRLLLIPAVISALIAIPDVNYKVRMTVIVAAAAPPAAMCTLQCIRYGKNSLYSSEIFAFGTILSVISLPLTVRLAEYLTKLIGRHC
ncbi:MAG: AEC family transporter [Ruminococcus sp.]|nr:AEC family transporter [Ruminococcus sp.]